MAEQIQHRAAEELAAGYKTSHRVAEVIAMILYAAMASVFFYRVAQVVPVRPVSFAIGAVLGYLAADFTSGLVHWFCDTWGSPEWPVVGPVFIRTFREHHVDPLSITRHDFIETNGATCMAVLPALIPAVLFHVDPSSAARVLLGGFFAAFCLCIPFTTQTHKWAHMDIEKVSWFGRMLIKSGVLLNREHHAIHHQPPFLGAYCITSGHCNPLLDKLQFFRRAERLITRVTGAIPREDDIGRDAATLHTEG
jgi:hypothetical protein